MKKNFYFDYLQLFRSSSHIQYNSDPIIMLLSSKEHVKLSKRYQKILFLSPALKETFVFLGMPSLGKESLVHCDKNGKILFEHVFPKSVDSFAMLSEREVIIAETRENRLTVLDLSQHTFTYILHYFIRQESDICDLDTFNETRLLCVRQSGQYNDNRFILTYYNYPLVQGDKPVAQFQGRDNEWTYEYITRKANNHSMIAWFKPRNDEEIQFKTFDLRQDPKGKYNHYTFRNTIGEPYGLNKVEMAICNLWQNKRGVFCLVCVSNKTEHKSVNKDGITNNNFIVDVQTQTVRQANFFFDKKFNDYLIDYYYLGPISMFRTFYFQDGKAERTPVYYVNNETEQIVAEDEWECTYRTKYFVPGFDNSTLIESQFQNGDVDEFTIMTKKILDPKEIALHFLLHINQDFDDDLLQDAIELLDNS